MLSICSGHSCSTNCLQGVEAVVEVENAELVACGHEGGQGAGLARA